MMQKKSASTQPLLKIRTRRVVLVALAVVVLSGLGFNLWAYAEYRAGQRANARHEFVQAQEHFEQCLKVWFLSPETQRLAGRAARRAGNFEAAAAHFRACRALGEHDDALDLESQLLRVQQGDFRSAAPALENRLAQQHPDSVAILEVLTPAYLQGYELRAALECVRRWLEAEPDSLPAWHYRAQVHSRLLVPAEVLASYRHIVELNPEDDEARLELAGQLLEARQPQEALEQYQIMRSRQGDTPQVLVGLGGCLRALKRPDEARDLLEKVLAAEPHNPEALAERSRLALEDGAPAAAEPWFRRALAERPAEHVLLYGLYQSLQRQGKQKEAAEVQAKMKAVEADLTQLRELLLQIARKPHDPELRYQAGVILLRNGKDQEGVRWLASALVEDPRQAATHRALVDYYERIGDAKQAAQHRQLGR
jgi:tetratricopeptide (TPR) repeat protein